jgi:hypothetical protein
MCYGICLGLSKYEEAMTDYQKVLDLEPTNKAAKLELDKLRDKCAAAAAVSSSHVTAAEEEKNPAKLDLKANISRMFAADGVAQAREARNNKINQEQQQLNPLQVLPVTKPPDLR